MLLQAAVTRASRAVICAFPVAMRASPVTRRASNTRSGAPWAATTLGAMLVATLLLAGCGKSAVSGSGAPERTGANQAPSTTMLGRSGSGGIVTASTTRLGGTDPIEDAAAIAQTVYPGFTEAVRPKAVVIVKAGDWPAALAASALAGAPLLAPILYSEGGGLPAASEAALKAMRPLGSQALGGAQVIAIGTPAPSGYRALTLQASSPYMLAAKVAGLVEHLHRGQATAAVLASATAPPALSMPAAGLAAQSGAPLLLLGRGAVPPATAAALARLRHPPVYAIGAEEAIGEAAMSALQKSGEATRIGAKGPIANAIRVAAYTNGHFGWGVEEPGHGLAFALSSRPLDAPAAALLSATGDYAPLLLLSSPGAVPAELERYLQDIQPGFGDTPESLPVRGVYNRGWLIGDQKAISLRTQSQLDSLLRSVPRANPASQPSLVP